MLDKISKHVDIIIPCK